MSSRWVPPTTYQLTTDDGRLLKYCLYGPEDGLPVVALHGTPGSRWERPDVVDAVVAAGLRMLVFGRPGYDAMRLPGRVVADVADDVAQLVNAQGWERFALTGLSGGGPHALACAALLSERVIRCTTVAGIAAPDSPNLDFGKTLDWVDDARQGEEHLLVLLGQRAKHILAEVQDDGTGRSQRMRAMCVDGLNGWIDDYLALIRPWGFELNRITAPVGIWYGMDDRNTTMDHTEWLLANVPNAEPHGYPGGHDPADADYRRMLSWLRG